MSAQDSLHYSTDGDSVILTCMCAQPSHGCIRIDKDRYTSQGKTELLFMFSAVPSGCRKFFSRIRDGFRAFRGEPIETDMEINQRQAVELADWMTDGNITLNRLIPDLFRVETLDENGKSALRGYVYDGHRYRNTKVVLLLAPTDTSIFATPGDEDYDTLVALCEKYNVGR